MRQTSRFFFCGHTSGKVRILLIRSDCEICFPVYTHIHPLLKKQVTLRDLRTFKMEHEFDAFSGSLSDFDVHGNLLAACGFSSRGLNGLACDRFLMVYDLRMMRAVTPLQVHVDPLFLRFIPTYTSRLAIISQTGITRGMWGPLHASSIVTVFVDLFLLESLVNQYETCFLLLLYHTQIPKSNNCPDYQYLENQVFE